MLDANAATGRQGFVYVLTNASIPHLVKVGRTARDADVRATELWQTGVPTPFDVYAAIRTPDCCELEALVHRDLSTKRSHKSREFFAVDPEFALERIRFWVEFQANEWVSANFDNMAIEPYRTWVSGDQINRLALETGQRPRIIADALEGLTAQEAADAIQRARANHEAEHKASLTAAGIAEEDHWSAFQ